MKVALKFGYIGFHFHGFARQPTVPTVEGTLIEKLIEREIIDSVKEAEIRSASRTDKHVSALSNVMTFYSNKSAKDILFLLSDEFDAILPYGITKVNDDFNPRFANSRLYQYLLPPHQYSIKKLQNALSLFEGEHDFSNFARLEYHRNPVRIIDKISILEKKNTVAIQIKAQTFLWNQIRRILQAAIKYCNNSLSLDQIKHALQKPNMPVDFNIAPAPPLILTNIDYQNLHFFEPNLLKERISFIESTVERYITNLVF